MGHLRRVSPTVRATSLLALGALAVHQLRYLIAYGPDSSEALAHQGHDYLAQIAPAVAGLTVAALAATLVAAAFRRRASAARGEFPVPLGTVLFAAALVAIFSTQEFAEGLLAAGHPRGLDALLAHGGWVAVPAAVAVGVLAATLMRALEGAEDLLTGILAPEPGRGRRPRREVAAPLTAADRPPLAALTLGFGFARRPPPAPLPR